MAAGRSLVESVYAFAPTTIQNLLVSLYGLKLWRREYGKRFTPLLQQFLAQERDSTKLRDYQQSKLQALINHSYLNVPYYRQLMDEHGITPQQVQDPTDLKKFPLLTRDTVRLRARDLLARNIPPSRRIQGKTSGTTGSPLQFYWDAETCLIKNVVDWRQKAAAGIKPFERMAFFLGRPIVPLHRRRPPYWRENRVLNQLFCSSFHLSAKTLPLYIAALRAYQPVAIEGYPSTLSIVARWLLEQGQTLPLRAAAFTSSETLLPSQRTAIESAFQCPLFDFYGMAERVVFATECELHTGKHLNEDFGITELHQRSSDSPTLIVATGLHNLAMPLIRYQTSDISSMEAEPCRCGRTFPLISNVTTKAEDLISTVDGRLIASSILTHPFKPLSSIVESQLVQESRELLVVKIVPTLDFSESDRVYLLSELQARLGPEMKIVLELVESIPRTPAGKFRWVISRVEPQF